MTGYIFAIIGATVLSALANILSPEKWRKYLRVVTGLVVVSVIVSPIGELVNIDIFSDFTIESAGIDANYQKRAVTEELEKRVAQDVEERVKKEFFTEAKASVRLRVNANFEIEGIDEINIRAKCDKNALRNRIAQIYEIKPGEVKVTNE